MPAEARTSRNAAKCSGSLLASTPSKSKTIARSATAHSDRTPRSLAGPNRHLQSVFFRRIWALVRRVVVTVRMVRSVEVELVDADGITVQIEVATRGISFRAAGHVAEHDGQMFGRSGEVVEGRDRERLSFE